MRSDQGRMSRTGKRVRLKNRHGSRFGSAAGSQEVDQVCDWRLRSKNDSRLTIRRPWRLPHKIGDYFFTCFAFYPTAACQRMHTRADGLPALPLRNRQLVMLSSNATASRLSSCGRGRLRRGLREAAPRAVWDGRGNRAPSRAVRRERQPSASWVSWSRQPPFSRLSCDELDPCRHPEVPAEGGPQG